MAIRNQHGPAHSPVTDTSLIARVGATLVANGASKDESFLTPGDQFTAIWQSRWVDDATYCGVDYVGLTGGTVGYCHDNVAELVAADPEVQWWFGYALNDEMWRIHSWGYRRADGMIMETTVEREAYIGAPLESRFWELFDLDVALP